MLGVNMHSKCSQTIEDRLKGICPTKCVCYTQTNKCITTKLVYYTGETSDKKISSVAMMKKKEEEKKLDQIKVQAICLFITCHNLSHSLTGDPYMIYRHKKKMKTSTDCCL